MKKLLILSLLIASLNVFSLTIGERRKEILNVINLELKELTRLNKQSRFRNPRVILRIAELYLEKARHIKEAENLKYLKLTSKQRRKVSKVQYFKASKHNMKLAQKNCIYILNKFKSFRKRSDVYYILAYNSKEFNDPKSAKKYFKLAVKFSANNSKISNKARLALADIYYNEREYPSAIRLYEKALKIKKYRNTWYTKDLFNLSWSYFRVGKKAKAISKMKEVHKLSKDNYYVDMSTNVERDLSYFYTDAGKTGQAVKFFKKQGKNIGKHMIKVAKHLKNQGKYTTAAVSFVEALKYTKIESDIIEIHTELLSIYEKFVNIKKHLNSSHVLYGYFVKNSLNASQIDILKYHVQKMSAVLQKRVAGKHFKKRKKLRKKRAKQSVEYFNMLSVIDSKTSHFSTFHAAETYFIVGSFNKAVPLYDKAYGLSKKRGDKRTERLSFVGMMSALGQKGITKSTNDKYLVKTYIQYLKINPSSKKSDIIYQRLFSNYYELKNIPKAEKVLLSYRRHFRGNHKTQEAMLAKIMDYYKTKGDLKSILKWTARIKRGEFVVGTKYTKTLKLLLLSMQFQDVEKAKTKGDQLTALKYMVQIYRDEGSTAEAKKISAYNIMLLFHKLKNIKLTYEWALKSLEASNPRDVKRFQESYIIITTEFLNRRHFEEAFNINYLTLKKVCKVSLKNKNVFFKNASITALANDQSSQMKKLLVQGRKCGIARSRLREAEFDLMHFYKENRRWKSYQNQITKLSKYKTNWSLLIEELDILKNELLIGGSKSELANIEKQMLKYYKYARSVKAKIPLEGLTAIALIKERKIKSLERKLLSIKLTFPEKNFNRQLKRKFEVIGQLTEVSLSLLQTRSGVGIVRGYRYLVTHYKQLSQDILNVKVIGKPPEYIKTFKDAMKETVKPLRDRANTFKNEAIKQITSNNILTQDNLYFVSGPNLPFEVFFIPPRDGVLMDRGGRR